MAASLRTNTLLVMARPAEDVEGSEKAESMRLPCRVLYLASDDGQSNRRLCFPAPRGHGLFGSNAISQRAVGTREAACLHGSFCRSVEWTRCTNPTWSPQCLSGLSRKGPGCGPVCQPDAPCSWGRTGLDALWKPRRRIFLSLRSRTPCRSKCFRI